MAKYELWLLDDAGNRITQINGFNYLAYSRTVLGMGTIQIGYPFENFRSMLAEYWKLDRRVEVWRAAKDDLPMRRDAVYLLRSPRIYTRESDGYMYLEFYGRSPIDLLNRRAIPQYAGSSYTTKTDYIDDMMKQIVRENCVYGSAVDETGVIDNDRGYPQYEFSVQTDRSLGPSVTRSFADSQLLDALKELHELSVQLNAESSSNRKIYYDVTPFDMKNFIIYIEDTYQDIILTESGEPLLDESAVQTISPVGFQFVTLADRFGIDRRDLLEFSEENGNFTGGSYQISHMEEVNVAYVKGQGEGNSRQVETVMDATRVVQSRWNRAEKVMDATGETTTAGLQSVGRQELDSAKPIEELYGNFISADATPGTPRSLYGLDWDLGDLVRVKFADMYFDAEIKTIHISIGDDGRESIQGRNVVEQ